MHYLTQCPCALKNILNSNWLYQQTSTSARKIHAERTPSATTPLEASFVAVRLITRATPSRDAPVRILLFHYWLYEAFDIFFRSSRSLTKKFICATWFMNFINMQLNTLMLSLLCNILQFNHIFFILLLKTSTNVVLTKTLAARMPGVETPSQVTRATVRLATAPILVPKSPAIR